MMKNRNLKHSPRCVLITRGQRVTEWRNTAESGDQPTNVSITGTSTETACSQVGRTHGGRGLSLSEKAAPIQIKGQWKTPGLFPSKVVS